MFGVIRLDLTTRKLQAVMAGAKTTTEPSATVSFYDENESGIRTKGGTKLTALNDTTDVDICAAPQQQNFVRNIDSVEVYNADTVTQTVTVKIDDSGTDTILVKAVLAAGASLHYGESPGWYVTPTGNSAILGTTTNDSATAGNVGEYIESVVGPVNFPTSGNYGDATSIQLTAGDWEVTAIFYNAANGATVTNGVIGGISQTSGNSATGLVLGSNRINMPSDLVGTDSSGCIAGYRQSLAATTTIYAKVNSTYTVATPQVYCRLSARRMR